jgi:hypothetical protein
MLELNCSYEESKKILELGYDFGRNFGDVYKKRDCSHKYILVNCEKIKAQDLLSQLEEKYHDTYIERFTLERLSIDHEDSLYNNKHNEYFELGEILCNPNSEGFVPIIPKAALEACLPKKVGIDNLYFRKFYKTTYSEEEFEVYQAGVNELESNAVIFSSSSIYEMFLWLHENYPAELKKKFDEVIG